jgi:hypothetical protein
MSGRYRRSEHESRWDRLNKIAERMREQNAETIRRASIGALGGKTKTPKQQAARRASIASWNNRRAALNASSHAEMADLGGGGH